MRLREASVASQISKQDRRVHDDLRAFITFVNISSQIVQVLGFIRLGQIPKARKGAKAMPRKGTGNRICCQHPLHILA